MVNPHHVELFYHVARHGGITRAARCMPWGIQQPALSGQLRALERQLGCVLFARAPFRLTPAGEALYAFARPFFDHLDAVATRLQRGLAPQLRIGAAEPVLCDHLPSVLRHLRQMLPGLQLDLRSGYQAQLEAWLLAGELDLTVTALERRPIPPLHAVSLLRLPLALVVPRRSKCRTAREFWRTRDADTPLISPPATETISRLFQRGLEDRGWAWPPAIVASSLATVARYVANGHGVGISVADGACWAGVRLVPLEGFPSVEIAALQCGHGSAVVESALVAMRDYVRAMWPAEAMPAS